MYCWSRVVAAYVVVWVVLQQNGNISQRSWHMIILTSLQSHSSIVGESCSWNSFVNENVKMYGVTHRSRLCFAINTNDIPPWIVDLDLMITYKWIENILVYKFLYGFIALYQHTTNYWVFDYCLGSAWLFYCKFISVPCFLMIDH